MSERKKRNPQRNRSKGTEALCYCNNVPRSEIEAAIRNGANTLNKIFDQTMAGVGACGGSCRRKLAPMLEQFQKDGTFPEDLPDTRKARKDGLKRKR